MSTSVTPDEEPKNKQDPKSFTRRDPSERRLDFHSTSMHLDTRIRVRDDPNLVKVKDINWTISKQDLRNHFSNYGKINHIHYPLGYDGFYQGFAEIKFQEEDIYKRLNEETSVIIDDYQCKIVPSREFKRLQRNRKRMAKRSKERRAMSNDKKGVDESVKKVVDESTAEGKKTPKVAAKEDRKASTKVAAEEDRKTTKVAASEDAPKKKNKWKKKKKGSKQRPKEDAAASAKNEAPKKAESQGDKVAKVSAPVSDEWTIEDITEGSQYQSAEKAEADNADDISKTSESASDERTVEDSKEKVAA